MTNNTNLDCLLKIDLRFIFFLGVLGFFDVSVSLGAFPLNDWFVPVDLLVPVVAVDAELLDS